MGRLNYTKSAPGWIDFNGASGIEVYGLAKLKDSSTESYEGERIMAEQYVQLLKELPEYVGQWSLKSHTWAF